MNLDLATSVLVLGVLQAGLYGFLPIAIVLSYKISRTIAFVHGGIAISAGLVYWVLTYAGPAVPGARPELPAWLGLVLVVGLGAALGGGYGAVVMSRRVASLPRMTLTVISLAGMLAPIGVLSTVLTVPGAVSPPSPFGFDSVTIAGVAVTTHRAVTLAIIVGLVVGVGLLLTRTHAGLMIRAIADDMEAGVWCGVPLHRVGTAVWTGSGAVAALAGALIAGTVTTDPDGMLGIFLRGLVIAVVGGLVSLPLALAGALLYGILETALLVGTFGQLNGWQSELILSGSLLLVVLAVARTRRENFVLLERQTL